MMGGQVGPGNVYQGAASGLKTAGQAAGQAATFQPAGITDNLSAYTNPHTQSVIDPALSDLERSRQMAVNDIGAQATAAGAFGGSRHGVAESLTNEAAMRHAGQLSANLHSQGFNAATGLAQQDIANQMAGQNLNLGAAGQLANISNLGFGMGQQIAGQQMQQGTMQQALMQRLIDTARGNFGDFTNSPVTSAQLPLQTIGSVPYGQTQTTTQQPGLFNYLSMGLGLL